MKGWRTLTFNAASLVAMVAGVALQYMDQLPISDAQAGISGAVATILVNLANMYLRSITTTPMGARE